MAGTRACECPDCDSDQGSLVELAVSGRKVGLCVACYGAGCDGRRDCQRG